MIVLQYNIKIYTIIIIILYLYYYYYYYLYFNLKIMSNKQNDQNNFDEKFESN